MRTVSPQASTTPVPLPSARMAREGVQPYLGHACREARKNSGLRLIEVAYALDKKSEAAMSRFESGQVWPHRVDEVVAVYSDQTGVPAIEIWRRAIEMWAQHATEEAVPPLPDELRQPEPDESPSDKAADPRRNPKAKRRRAS